MLGGPPGLATPPKHPPKWPGGPPSFDRSHFFCLLYLNIYFKIFQKRRMSKLLPEGTYVGYPPWGGPPGAPRAPPGVPKCPRGLEIFSKIPKKYIKNYHAEKYHKL